MQPSRRERDEPTDERQAPSGAVASTAAPAATAGPAAQPFADVAWPGAPRWPEDLGRIVDWDAASLSVAIRRRVVTCVEVMTAYLDHIDVVNPKVNAIVSLRPRAALLAEAERKDELIRGGKYQGWMHGFPHAVKDLADVAGLFTSHGLLPPDAGVPVPSTDSLFVERMRAAGAIFIGKTNVPQLGLGSQTYNDVFGTTLNAYDQRKTAGGSSGGAAVAVALRMVPVADGSDFMGSLRNPPGWNNVYGLRPSVGRVPSAGGDQFVAQAGVEGPIARTALDLDLLLRTMAGYDARAPLSLEDDDRRRSSIAGGRVAWFGDLGGYLPMEPEVLDITGRAVASFSELGLSVTKFDSLPAAEGFGGNEDLWPTWLTYRHWMTGMSVKSAVDLGLGRLLKPEAIYEYEGLVADVDGGPLSAVDVYENSVKRSGLYEGFRQLFETYDYAVLPTAQLMPFDAGVHWPKEVAGRRMSSYHRWMEVTAIATLINAPAAAVPAGFGRGGTPIGLQIIGRNHDDWSVLDFAEAWERLTQWVQRVPPPLASA
jgi:amidase